MIRDVTVSRRVLRRIVIDVLIEGFCVTVWREGSTPLRACIITAYDDVQEAFTVQYSLRNAVHWRTVALNEVEMLMFDFAYRFGGSQGRRFRVF